MTSRRGAVLVGLVALVAWLHGWGVMRWGAGTPPVAAPVARPAAVQVVWQAPPPAAATPVPPPADAKPAPRLRPVAAPRAVDVAPDSVPADIVAPSPLPQTLPTPGGPALPTEPSAALVPDALHAVADTGVTAVDAPAPADRPRQAVPTYRTRIPPATLVSYRMSRSGLTGTGELDWRPEGGAYSLRLEGRMPLIGTLITQTSRGRFDAAGLAPERYTDKRLRRGELAANFQRADGAISFSGQHAAVPLTAGVQDRVSVMVQLAAIAAAWARPPAVGTPLQVRVVGARGDANVWSLRFEGPDTVETPEGPVPALRFLREGDGPHDTRAEFWLDPARSHLPVRVRISDGGSDPFELLRLK